MSDALRLTEALIACPSVTPAEAGSIELLQRRLAVAGFACERLDAGAGDARVANLWAVHEGARPGPMVILAGHVDVVPPGPRERWQSDPFVPSHRNGRLYGRGAADMKTAVACMTVAAEAFVTAQPAHAGNVALLFTSNEEGSSGDGSAHAVELLRARGLKPLAALVGEPTSVERVGDMVKNGRRGTLSARLVVRGIQGHVAYPQFARNPIHQVAPAIAELATTVWDEGNEHFLPTSFQVSNIHGGAGVGNVIPGEVVVDCNFRNSAESSAASLRRRFEALLQRHGLEYTVEWALGGEPFLTRPGSLHAALTAAIEAEFGITPLLSTTGGTSDGRYLATWCQQVMEFGVRNASAHQVDEWVDVDAIEPLARVYQRTLQALLA
ncbi:MAG: succinyl-diaminopimelate desuccinylase [Ideonella sp. WA131b]|nr:succinyl-diaminopimelate desuccinylase [Ideonella sp. WA131b]